MSISVGELGSGPYKREPEPVKEIYKNGFQELGTKKISNTDVNIKIILEYKKFC